MKEKPGRLPAVVEDLSMHRSTGHSTTFPKAHASPLKDYS
jgi:hypothetical protein